MTTDTVEASLYQEIGGAEAIDALVEDFYPRIEKDEALQAFFTNTDMTKQRQMMKSFLTVVTGGPNNYSGRSMKAAHQGRGIKAQDFALVAQHLAESMAALELAEEHQSIIMSAAAGLQGDIVDS